MKIFFFFSKVLLKSQNLQISLENAKRESEELKMENEKSNIGTKPEGAFREK